MPIRLRFLMLCLVTLRLAPEAAAASLTGRALDISGAPLPGVTVEVRNARGETLLTTTDATGSYRFTLPSGRVALTFRLMNFATRVRNDVVVIEPELAGPDVTLPLQISADVVVTAKTSFRNLAELDASPDHLLGIADSSGVGVISGAEIDRRPVQRPGEILETIPGVVVSQHSGEGKANQFYLRGFNLDHGTDFAVSVAGVPVNMPTHGHGQGYADMNFLIPELVTAVQYRKGPYFADEGDFSSAGAANIAYANRLEKPLVLLQGGSFGYTRALVAGSTDLWGGLALGAIETTANDGPWVRSTALEKSNAVFRFTRGDHRGGWSVTGMGYRSQWNATDQIPRRAIVQGGLSRFDTVDDSDGGETHRYSLSGDWQHGDAEVVTRVSAFVIDYALDLYSNFTYFLDDPERGDQFQQIDERRVWGASATHRWRSQWHSRSMENVAGVQLRRDDIAEVGLHKTQARRRFATVRHDGVQQTSVSAFFENSTQWTRWARMVSGVRGDFYQFDVASNIDLNSGKTSEGLVSPKVSLIFGPWHDTELYLNAGYSFHSNDGRGATARVDPITGDPAQAVDALVRSRGAELGVRSRPLSTVALTSTIWMLDLDSELLFVGDAGNTEATRPSSRRGVELDVTWRIGSVVVDADVAFSNARYTDASFDGNEIPGSVGFVSSLGAAWSGDEGWGGELRYRLLGSRPLVENGGVRSDPSHLVSARMVYPLTSAIRLQLDVFNLFNTRASDIDYFYTSRLHGEPLAGVDDVHTHPAEPRSIRAGLSYAF